MLLFYNLQRKYLNTRCIFFEDLLPYTILTSYIKWRYCRCHVTDLRKRHHTDRPILKSSIFWWPPATLRSDQIRENKPVGSKVERGYTQTERQERKIG
jgi:hypothetical protein